ncbi:MAG TPA: restriction endonuclease [Xanthomonadales bacterium]|nr:restriction endonuclease [Xanthomonadales bacterium]
MSIAVALIVLGLAGLATSVMLGMRAGAGSAQRERLAGLAAMRELSWKDFAALVVKAFETRGYKPVAGARKPGDDGVDHVLERGGQKHILQVKHGGAYHVGAAAVRRLLVVLDQQHAAGGILATSGEFDSAAREAAKRQPVVLLEGEALWQQVGPLLPATSLAVAQSRVAQMESAGRRRVMAITALSLLLVAGGIAMVTMRPMIAGSAVAEPPPPAPVAVGAVAEGGVPPSPQPAPTEAPATPAPAAPTAAIPRRAPATPQELAVQRDLVAAEAMLVAGVVSASWQAPSNTTLVIALRAGDDEKRNAVIKSVCEVILKRDDLAFTRLQIYDFNLQGDAEKNVRFRQCQ